MKDEIKEIELDHFNSIKELKQNVETWVKEDDMYWERWFSLYDLKILLDYITTLQEENEKIRKMNKAKHKYAMNMEDKYITERYKNQKAIEIYENSSSIKYKQKRFMEDKTTADLMYEALQGDDDNVW